MTNYPGINFIRVTLDPEKLILLARYLATFKGVMEKCEPPLSGDWFVAKRALA